jgi:hypothetical protein
MVPKAFEAGYPNTTGFRKVVKATILIKKKEGMSDEEFMAHYNNVHAQRAVPILQRHGIISYSLVMRLFQLCCARRGDPLPFACCVCRRSARCTA